MSRLSLFKTSSSSSQSSASTGSRRSSMLSDVSATSPVSYVQIPGLLPQRQSPSQSASPSTGGSDFAEMLDDDNVAWGKPKKSKSARR
ncbi:hypothetical protein C8Q80DRAFT_1133414 [Daedaleopsis nitida]|nr:hypothetical protein C8Q80DRAFT_1133414 [Daedaleopsis nitida]